LWCTTSLRGLAGGNLKVSVLSEGVHSGDASGIVPSSFRILRQLLSRLEDQVSGKILVEDLFVDIPGQRLQQAQRAAQVLGNDIFDKFPFLPGMTPMNSDLTELVLNRTWRPALSVTGVDGMPSLGNAGNVLRPHTAVKLSLRLPPTLNPKKASEILQRVLEENPPNGAKVEFEVEKAPTGGKAPGLSTWAPTGAASVCVGLGPCGVGAGVGVGFSATLPGSLGVASIRFSSMRISCAVRAVTSSGTFAS